MGDRRVVLRVWDEDTPTVTHEFTAAAWCQFDFGELSLQIVPLDDGSGVEVWLQKPMPKSLKVIPVGLNRVGVQLDTL